MRVKRQLIVRTFRLFLENVLRGRPAVMSSLYTSFTTADKAVDGNADGRWASKVLACTKSEKEPWLAVEMPERKRVLAMCVGNRNEVRK